MGRREALAGYDCFPSHDYPPATMCSDEPCLGWLERNSLPQQCDSEHAHGPHYTWTYALPIGRCDGRQYCDRKHFEEKRV